MLQIDWTFFSPHWFLFQLRLYLIMKELMPLWMKPPPRSQCYWDQHKPKVPLSGKRGHNLKERQPVEGISSYGCFAPKNTVLSKKPFISQLMPGRLWFSSFVFVYSFFIWTKIMNRHIVKSRILKAFLCCSFIFLYPHFISLPVLVSVL